MKTAAVQHVPQQWAQILDWITSGEEVALVQDSQIIAKIVPAHATPDFVARAQAVWGTLPDGQPLSAIVKESRGSRT